MSVLRPAPVELLLTWALQGLERERSVFGLPKRSFWQPREGLDLSVAVAGGRAASPLGPAAGPHTQLAQNIVVSWLGGARVLELKTVQVLDRLQIPRPSIDAPAEGYNVESSQELRLEESLEQYRIAWLLIHVLAARGLAGPAAERAVREGRGLIDTRFDASAGYDLAGIRSDPVARFLDGLSDSSDALDALRQRLPASLRGEADIAVRGRVSDTVALSTFHGCPAGEIEGIVEHLFDRHRMHVVVKLNPTLLGYDGVAHLLHERLGRRDIVLDREAFERDLQWDQALPMLARLAESARRRGLTLGIKLTNTLVVRNTRGRLTGDTVYLSGAPLHPIAITLADRLARELPAPLPRSFSAGVKAENFADTVACGFAPVTTCTDLLQPTGYRRLSRYLKSLEDEMERLNVTTVPDFIAARSREAGASPGAVQGTSTARAPGETALDPATINLAAYALRVDAPPAPETADPAAVDPATRPQLRFLDCAACNRCVVVCPNGAFFSLATPPQRAATHQLLVRGGAIERREDLFEIACDKQWATDADFCNQCGNCDTFCIEAGGPQQVKPRFHRTRAGYEAAPADDGILVESAGERVTARFDGVEHHLERTSSGWRFGNDAIEVLLDEAGEPLETRVLAAVEGRSLALSRFHALRLLVPALLASVNSISSEVAAR